MQRRRSSEVETIRSHSGAFSFVYVCVWGCLGNRRLLHRAGLGRAGPPHPELLCIAELTDYLRISRAAVRVGYVRRHKRTALITERLLLYAAAIFINVHFLSAVRVNTHPPVSSQLFFRPEQHHQALISRCDYFIKQTMVEVEPA